MEAAFAVIGGVLGFAFWRGTVPRFRGDWLTYVAFGAIVAWVAYLMLFGPPVTDCLSAYRC